jgi:hypothetical protein
VSSFDVILGQSEKEGESTMSDDDDDGKELL